MHKYDHRVHVGNAGDVWKHFLLLEAADFLLTLDSSLVYAESHVGRPEYALRTPGEWEGGIGKLWSILPILRNFCYFDILADLNPERLSSIPGWKPVSKEISRLISGSISGSFPNPLLYPGSACLIYELAKRKEANLQADVWDNDPEVARSWEGFSETEWFEGSFQPDRIVFHQGDGILGALSQLERSPAGLLFIDPPYINPEDVLLAEKLLRRARKMGWIVLWWYMTDLKTVPDGLQTFELQFDEMGLNGGRWNGAGLALAGAESERYGHLLSHMHRQIDKLNKILKSN